MLNSDPIVPIMPKSSVMSNSRERERERERAGAQILHKVALRLNRAQILYNVELTRERERERGKERNEEEHTIGILLWWRDKGI